MSFLFLLSGCNFHVAIGQEDLTILPAQERTTEIVLMEKKEGLEGNDRGEEAQVGIHYDNIFTPISIESYNHQNIDFDNISNHESKRYINTNQTFPYTYSEVPGVLTFRGGHFRDRPSYGTLEKEAAALSLSWQFQTSFNPDWGGGSGWTGQPAIVHWDDDVREMMNIYDSFKGEASFVEVIQGSLDGNVYFLDLESGEQTRPPIHVKNPIKGSVSVDSRGYPLLYVGDGVPYAESFGFYIYNLIDGSLLYLIPGRDDDAYREWGAFDSSALVNRETDTFVVGGENGMFYQVPLNTTFDREKKCITVEPHEWKMRYKVEGNHYQGIENSVAVYKNLAFFANNGGSIIAVNMQTMTPVWSFPALDDTDSTIVVEVIDDVPYLYTATEVDNIGRDGDCHLRKINGLTGDVIWQKSYAALLPRSCRRGACYSGYW
ncbi:PQQ-binding-like beta-propeller repeat protein [Alteribacter aurantiacus]|uniref:PQQ-binding-like beta-propeller repeat protein n=1 Tax=Alteribacter aurantiacus TaxID=254410 RepID=UPI00068601BD|nr:PQQ-binding-like beta-propeller repeat protein [Alteribacter aurantiacus]